MQIQQFLYSRLSFLGCLLLLTAISFTSCVDQDFDEPPADIPLPDLTANTTIADLKQKHVLGELETITEDLIIEGVVVADDATGNLYRQIIVQDATGGIEVRVNKNDLFADYPVGRQLFIKCNGLTLGDYNGLPQLGGGTYIDNGAPRLAAIEEIFVNDFLFKGKKGVEITPTVVTIGELTTALQDRHINTLIQLNDVEFANSSTGQPYANGNPDTGNPSSLNHDLLDCDKNVLVVRTSGYSDFAVELTPTGKGTLLGIYTVFRTTKQMTLRGPSDLNMDGTRCDGSTGGGGGGGGGTGELTSIKDVRAAFSGTETSVPADTKIKGIVTSDRSNGNINSQNLFIQDDSGSGILVRFDDTHTFDLNDELEIVVSGEELSEFNDLLQINNVPLGNASKTGTGSVTAREIDIVDLLDEFSDLEGSLVKIDEVTIAGGGGTYDGALVFDDGTGSIDCFTLSNASFSSETYPSGKVTVTAIVTEFRGTPQVSLRMKADVEGGSGGGGGGGGGGSEELMNISDIRALYSGTNTSAPASKKIKGIVITDRTNENITGRNLVIQEENGGGIVIRFDAVHEFNLNDELEVVVSGQEISAFNGLVQLNNVPIGNATKTGTGTITPKELTIQEVKDQFSSIESTLVKITDVSFEGSGTFNGAQTVKDASGSIALFTRSAASFSGDSFPTTTFTLTAVVSIFNDPQLQIRNKGDMEE